MCIGCWQEYGRPVIDTPEVRASALAIDRVYDFEGAGGYLHITVDDWNIEDSSLAFCGKAIDADEWKVSPESLKAQRECFESLSRLSIEERASALALHYGYLSSP